MACGTSCGQAASGKQFTKIGSVFPAVFCTNAFKPGSSWASGMRSSDRCCAFMAGRNIFCGNGNRWIVVRVQHLWEARIPVITPPIEPKRAARSRFWWINEELRWRCGSPEPMCMTNGRWMTWCCIFRREDRLRINICVRIKATILKISINLFESKATPATSSIGAGAMSLCQIPARSREKRSIRLAAGWSNEPLAGCQNGVVSELDGARSHRTGSPWFTLLVPPS
jgi:hypothetical protein